LIQAVGCDARGDVYLNSQDATLVALDPATGQERWRFATGARRMTPPVVAGGLAYVIGDTFDGTGTLSAVDATTGEERWRFETGQTFSAPVVADGVVYAAGTDYAVGAVHLYALDAATGTERWRRSDVPPASSLAVEQATLYVGYFDDCAVWHLAAFDAATGDERSSWSIETPTRNCPIAGTVVDGVAYIVRLTGEGGIGDGYLAALDAATGAERWRWEFDPGGLATPPVMHAGTVYVNALGTLHAVDAAGGTERWRFDAGGFLWPVVAADGTVFVFVESFPNAGAADEATLFALDAATGTERWHFPATAPRSMSEPSFPVVAVAEGVAYVGGGATISAVDAASGAERWRANLALALPESTPEGRASPAAGS
jgi:outer membrane protein assembly factor BamB